MKRANLLRMIGFVSGALACSAPVHAQQAPAKLSDFVSIRPAAPDDIVVTGQRDATNRQVELQARSISQIDGSWLHEPLGRFRTRICPGVIGLPRDMAELMVDRIRFNAERIGAGLARENDCTANLILAFVRDGEQEIASLLRSKDYFFNQLRKPEVDALLKETGPVRAWSNTVVRSRFGDELRGEAVPANRNLATPPVLNVANSHSHIFLAHRLDIESAVVVIDLAAVDGLSVNQIADYVTMRGFARTRAASGDAAANTILTLFDPNGPPVAGLTPFDVAYLKSVYSSYDGARALTTIVAASREMRKAAQEGVRAN